MLNKLDLIDKKYNTKQSLIQNSESLIQIHNSTNYKFEPLENFDKYVLLENDQNDYESILKKGPTRGYSKWHDQTNEIIWKECVILEYIKSDNEFLIKWPNTNIFKKVFIFSKASQK